MPTPTIDMAAAEPKRKPSSRYVEYLHAYTRRLKRGAGAAATDGAGLLCGERYQGRNTPLKGKGLPPAENQESPHMVGGIRTLPAQSWPETDPLLTLRPASAEDLRFRPSVRTFKSAFASSMDGAGAIVVDEEPEQRRLRRHGLAAPPNEIEYTKRRVAIDSMVVDSSLEWWEVARPSSVRTWREAPPAMVDTITRHRYSDPESAAAPAKLITARVDKPPLSRHEPAAVRALYTTALDDYCGNRARAALGSKFCSTARL